ncbi:MAG: ABC transporter substrate-binding protein [Gammaproteobacteria bacterium]|nr:ABC transporter substrate-binding protein [Gammaproteobacteria bacterium]MDH3887504.1 ABC transporter substrate-binding protein [Gammaproteobacteria bacterium]MDH3985056.1 ABC transporter substrate-binding protein [Gammaproteobacteria bacterium]
MKANFLAVFLLFTFALPHTATATPYFPNNYQNTATDVTRPGIIVRTGVEKLTRFIRSGQAQDRVKAMSFLETEVAPYFDFEYMTRWAAGPAWRSMSPEQRARMQSKLTSAFMTTLVQKLTSYTNQPIRYFTPRGQGSNDVSVSAWIMQTNGIPTKLDFRFYRSEDGWKIFDVKAAGNSAVVYYRNMFRKMHRQTPPSRY